MEGKAVRGEKEAGWIFYAGDNELVELAEIGL